MAIRSAYCWCVVPNVIEIEPLIRGYGHVVFEDTYHLLQRHGFPATYDRNGLANKDIVLDLDA